MSAPVKISSFLEAFVLLRNTCMIFTNELRTFAVLMKLCLV